ncbi:hypothetical protein BX661DRAFT_185060 [Kickxella alabastrina]|uniref:uncharacterized protein n=1 Tax=Kickxella alabastrina TaxID=61397 RepID=UPI00221E6560|nr:uncharacterized protein BX661DRAFT_185060 [Kickxella alabastrina]KAI7824983.1 hypothetical protein BX661DRAFT_185060 [Kickxella alabastrina]
MPFEDISGWLLLALLLTVITWRVLLALPWCPYYRRYNQLFPQSRAVHNWTLEWEDEELHLSLTTVTNMIN